MDQRKTEGYNLKETDKTGFKLMVSVQSRCVPEILTLCRMNKIFLKKKTLEREHP